MSISGVSKEMLDFSRTQPMIWVAESRVISMQVAFFTIFGLQLKIGNFWDCFENFTIIANTVQLISSTHFFFLFRVTITFFQSSIIQKVPAIN